MILYNNRITNNALMPCGQQGASDPHRRFAPRQRHRFLDMVTWLLSSQPTLPRRGTTGKKKPHEVAALVLYWE